MVSSSTVAMLQILLIWLQMVLSVMTSSIHSRSMSYEAADNHHLRSRRELYNGIVMSVSTTFDEDAGLGQIQCYGSMFEMHNMRSDGLSVTVQRMSVHTSSVREDTLFKIYTSPGALDYIRHPTAWDARSDVIVKGMGKGQGTMLPESAFDPVEITAANPIMSFYVTMTSREMLSSLVGNSYGGNDYEYSIAMQTSNLGITYGITKVWPFADMEFFSLVNSEFLYFVNYDEGQLIEYAPTASPSDLNIILDQNYLNITTDFQGGLSADGIMFDFKAKEHVVAYSMDIISSYVGMQDIEIYFRRGSYIDVDMIPSEWLLIASISLYGRGYSNPVRTPWNAFNPILIESDEVVSFYITCSSGPYIQMTDYEGLSGNLFAETAHVQEFIGVSKNYPFLESDVDAGWNGRIYYDLFSSSNYCGDTLDDALNCGTHCPSGQDSACPSGQTCFLEILSKECLNDVYSDDMDSIQDTTDKKMFYCGASYEDAANCGTYCGTTGLDSECGVGEKFFPNVFLDASCSDDDFYNDDMDSVKDTTDKKMFYCGTSYEDAANCGAYCGITGLDSECGVGETCFANVYLDEKCSNLRYCGYDRASASQCAISCPDGNDNECPSGQFCFDNITNDDCNDYSPLDNTGLFVCGATREDALRCGDFCSITGQDDECPDGQKCFTNIFQSECRNMNYCGTDRSSATQCNTPCPSGDDAECPGSEQCFENISAIECSTMHFCGTSLSDAKSCGNPCPSGSSLECPSGKSCFLNIVQEECFNTHYCGTSRESATQCNESCPSGSSAECPDGQACFDNIFTTMKCSSIPEVATFSKAPSSVSTIAPLPTIDFMEACIVPSEEVETSNFVSPFDGVDETYGNMFDIIAKKDIMIVAVDLHLNTFSTVDVELYVTCCNLSSYKNVQRHPTAWELFSKVSINAMGYGKLSSIPSTEVTPVCISMGSSRGFYFTTVNEGVLVQTKVNDMIEGDVFFSNSDLSLAVGVGRKYKFHHVREPNVAWNGGLQYIVQESIDFKEQATAMTSSSMFLHSSLFFVPFLCIFSLIHS